MKVLYLAPPRSQPGMLSAFTFLDEEIRAIAAQGHHIYMVTYPVSGALVESLGQRIHLFSLPQRELRRDLFRILAFLWNTRKLIPLAMWLRPLVLIHAVRLELFSADVITDNVIDVIHSHFAWPGGFGGVLAKRVTGRPLVATLRGMDVLLDRELDYGLRRNPAYDAALRVLLRNADFTTHVSRFIREHAIELGANAANAKSVLKGVDCQSFNGTSGPQLENPVTRPIILTVAGLAKRKGIDIILQALGRLVGCRDFSYVIVGEGPELTYLTAQCHRLSLTQNTTFAGLVPRNRVPDFFAECHIFVLGSLLEASGNVLLEAMASGRPVVCTDSGGPAEYVVNGETGFVVPPADPEVMAAKIKQLLDNPKLRLRMGQQGRRRAVDQFSYARMVGQIVAIYNEAIKINST